MSRRRCCSYPCQNKDLWFWGFTQSGEHSSFTGSTFSPVPFPSDWPGTFDTRNYCTNVYIGATCGCWNTITLKMGDGDGCGGDRTYHIVGTGSTIALENTPTLPYSWGFTCTGVGKWYGLKFVPTQPPDNWIAGAFVGNSITVGGIAPIIASNTVSDFEIRTGYMCPDPVFQISINFTNQISGGNVSKGVFTAHSAPSGWGTNKLVGFHLSYKGTRYKITANTPTTLTLDPPPSDGSESGWCYLYDSDNKAIVSTIANCYRYGDNQLLIASSLIEGLFTGCYATIGPYGGDTIASDSGGYFTLTTITWPELPWSFTFTKSGDGTPSGSTFAMAGCPASPAGLPIRINGQSYTVTSVSRSTITLSTDVNIDFPWRLNVTDVGEYWDIVSGTWKWCNDSPDGYHYVESLGTGSKAMWHNELLDRRGKNFYQYTFSNSQGFSIMSSMTATRLFFGPCGACSFEVTNNTTTLNCCGKTATVPIGGPGVMTVQIFKADGVYHIIGAGAVNLGLTVDAETWLASPHKVGVGGDGTIIAYGLISQWNARDWARIPLQETRGSAFTANPSSCASIGAAYIPGEITAVPAFSVTIPGVGTYGLRYGVAQGGITRRMSWAYNTDSKIKIGSSSYGGVHFWLQRLASIAGMSASGDQQFALVSFDQNDVYFNYNQFSGYGAFVSEQDLMNSTMTLRYCTQSAWGSPPSGWPETITLVKV